MISNFENLNPELLGDVNVAVTECVKILELAVKNSLQLGNVKKKRIRKSQIWYDTECRQSRIVINFDNSEQNKPLANRRSNFCARDGICEASAIHLIWRMNAFAFAFAFAFAKAEKYLHCTFFE